MKNQNEYEDDDEVVKDASEKVIIKLLHESFTTHHKTLVDAEHFAKNISISQRIRRYSHRLLHGPTICNVLFNV